MRSFSSPLGTLAVLGVAASLSLSSCTAAGARGQQVEGTKVPTTRVRVPATRLLVPNGPDVAPDGTILGAPTSAPHVRMPRRPNIVMITSDDMSVTDLPYVPAIRRLMARQGTTLENAVAPTPICVPARASLITGQYATNHGARTITGPQGGFLSLRESGTLPVWLHRAGYRTYFSGKYLNGYGDAGTKRNYIPPGWNDWRATVGGSTYAFFAPMLNNNGRLHQYHQYSTDVIRNASMQQLDIQRRHRSPFFMWINYVAPHSGGPDTVEVHSSNPADNLKNTVPAPQDRNTFRSLQLPSFPDMFKTPRNAPRASPTHRHWDATGRSAIRLSFQRRIEALQDVDRSVAATIRKLRQMKQLRKTIVIFASDNGFVVGEHNVLGKLWHYNDILRIPMLIRGPGVPRGKVVRTVVTNPDIATTIAALARARPTRPQDGVNIFPWLRAGKRVRITPIAGWPVDNGRRPLYEGVRVGDWTYVHFRGRGEELYDRAVDPWEMRNLARTPRYHQQLLMMRTLTREYLDCKGETCPKTFYMPPK